MAKINYHKAGNRKISINLPASKSESNRALIIRELCDNDFQINHLSDAQDTRTLEKLLNSKERILDAGHAGTCFRFLTALLSIGEGTKVLTGSSRMQQRPVRELVNALRQLGANIQYLEQDGFPPLKISGKPLMGGEIGIYAGVSSQFISALLMIAPLMEKGLNIWLRGEVISRPYIDMTLSMMNYFGVSTGWEGDEITVKPQKYVPRNFGISADWSSASYWYAIAALNPECEIFICGLELNSLQGDEIVVEIFRQFGVETGQKKDGVRIYRNPDINLPGEFTRDFTHYPDLAQTMAVVCAGLNIKTHLTGLGSLKIKETDRLLALKNELEKFGKEVRIKNNSELLILNSPLTRPLSQIKTYSDHRMAMAFAPLVMLTGGFDLENPGVVEKSYPGFWEEVEKVGISRG